MGDSAVIKFTGRQLVELLKSGLSSVPGLTVSDVTLESPLVLRSGTILSVFLYRVDIDDSAPKKTLSAAETQPVHSALPLNLYYLITPIAEEAEDAHLLLNAAMEILNDSPVVPVSSPPAPRARTLEILCAPLPLDEITRLWVALNTPYRLSLSYEVKVR
jgi:hypothetical protein